MLVLQERLGPVPVQRQELPRVRAPVLQELLRERVPVLRELLPVPVLPEPLPGPVRPAGQERAREARLRVPERPEVRGQVL